MYGTKYVWTWRPGRHSSEIHLVIWCILMAVSFVGAFLITILIGFKDIPEEEA